MKTPRLWCVLFYLLIASSTLAQSTRLSIDTLEHTSLDKATKEVGFSALLEGSVDSNQLTVFVMVDQPHLNGAWRVFQATISPNPGSDGTYRWSAICHFGELNGKDIGNQHQLRAIAFDKSQLSPGRPLTLTADSISTQIITVTRTK
jgi:hypothetical protein